MDGLITVVAYIIVGGAVMAAVGLTWLAVVWLALRGLDCSERRAARRRKEEIFVESHPADPRYWVRRVPEDVALNPEMVSKIIASAEGNSRYRVRPACDDEPLSTGMVSEPIERR